MTVISEICVCGALAAAALAVALPAPVQAASCTIIPQSVSFGSYDPFEPADLDGVGNVRIECDTSVNFSVSLGQGSGSYSARVMSSGPNQLSYNLFTSAQRIVIWGDGTGGSQTVSDAAQAVDLPIYGTIASGQNVRPGTYTDTIFVTVTY